MEPLQDSPQAGCWSPARSPDTTQKDLHVVSQVAGAPELTLSPLLPDVQLPIPPVPQDSSADLSQLPHLWCSLRRHSGLPGLSDVPSPDLNINVGQSVSGRSCCLLCTRAGLFSGTRKPASFWVRQHGLQHCSSGVEGLSIPVGILQQTSATHPLVKSGIYTLGIRSTSHGSRQHTYTGYNPGKKTVSSCGDS
jgi:hypothetical protein